MAIDLEVEQKREWTALYDQIREVLAPFGEPDDEEEKDYLLVGDNLGSFEHRIETNNLEIVKPVAIKALQKLLAGYPNWEIMIAVCSPDKDKVWPRMGLIVSGDEIVDGLQRQYLSKEFQNIEYEGSRPLGSQFRDVVLAQNWHHGS